MRETRRHTAASTVVKRSLLIAGHATSISLEQDFWDGLRSIAASRALSVAALVAEIDAARKAANLSSAIRVFVLRQYRAGDSATASFSASVEDLLARQPVGQPDDPVSRARSEKDPRQAAT